MQPRREQDGTFAVSVAVQARRIEDVDGFIEALEALGTVPRTCCRPRSRPTEDGLIEAVLEASTCPGRRVAATTATSTQPAPASARAAVSGGSAA